MFSVNFDGSVSIHAPREGCDYLGVDLDEFVSSVSIHAPREGCDKLQEQINKWEFRFQFTHPGRGATTLAR